MVLSSTFGFDTVPETFIDGVHRLAPSGISILIVGGGIGGLTLALEGWRQGHNVRVLEKSPKLDTIGKKGDTFGILPPGVVTLRYYPTLHKDFEDTSYDALTYIYAHSGRMVLDYGEAVWNLPESEHAAKDVRVPWIRSRFGMVKSLETQARRLGIPIEYGKNVIKYDEDETKAFVKTETGDVYYADLVVAADGIGTKSHKHVVGKPMPAMSSGAAAYRGLVSMDRLKDVSEDTKKRFLGVLSGQRSEFRVFLASGDMHMDCIITPDFVNYVLTHDDSGDAAEAWRSTISAPAVLELMDAVPGWDPALREIISKTPDNSIIDWKLLWRNPQPQWASKMGRVVQLGDCAHSFLPTSANGATQAMEDAVTLATCLRLGGRDKVVESVKTHVLLRYERVSTLQRFGFAQRQTLHKTDPVVVEKNPEAFKLKMSKWIWQHDPVQYARDNFHKAFAAVVDGAEFQNTNLPPGAKYEPWTIEEELARESQGLRTTLYSSGDWS
ncbi:hypothetical protein S7711_09276 [Stachybotrys chartarum IBT 7711]|uniref:FAD-binding domain-containing protein n=1 Tax=Stachybotrys chartarum (strain CBS 109288 / IBT 7711) TaxID=1280523 RepID=A0A084AW83_STACB|nr:hypothetical protein S7711_09276 [Stachybotrys chartarum IBT 7711]KFA49198.1 hypothetical protein S40293_07211 [Stachybotrys chartarum IBT 40293]KFA76963.1 hypothetical protein S40288_05193 [Stachybotrys chartarum IBT 40288]